MWAVKIRVKVVSGGVMESTLHRRDVLYMYSTWIQKLLFFVFVKDWAHIYINILCCIAGTFFITDIHRNVALYIYVCMCKYKYIKIQSSCKAFFQIHKYIFPTFKNQPRVKRILHTIREQRPVFFFFTWQYYKKHQIEST